jgi:hypothetical protein
VVSQGAMDIFWKLVEWKLAFNIKMNMENVILKSSSDLASNFRQGISIHLLQFMNKHCTHSVSHLK